MSYNATNALATTLEAVTNQMTAAVTCCSRDFRYLWANQGYADWLQRPLHEIVGHPILDVLGKDAFESLRPYFERVLGGEKVSYEEEVNFQGIGLRWISATYTPMADLQGGTSGWVAVVLDITERRKTERALRESEERLRLAAQAGRMFAYSWDAATGVIERSGESAKILGIDEGARLTGQQAIERVHPDDREGLLAAMAGLCPDRPFLQVIYRIVRPDESVVWVERQSRAYFDKHGKKERIVGMIVDITERKIAEAELRDAQDRLRTSEERLRLGQWAAHIGTFDLNLRTGVDVWTPEIEALYGLPPGGFGGTLAAFENLIHPGDRERIVELTREMIETGHPAEAEWRAVWPDGSIHWIAGRGQVLMDESGQPSRMLGVNIDITERKRAEEAVSGMTRKLLEAQEQERARIARELHDDITQRLAMLAIEIDQIQEFSGIPFEVKDQAHEFSRKVKEISIDLQFLSHELHSPKLEYLGTVGGMKSWCNEFSERQGIEVEFESSGSSLDSLPPEISLCLFRVLQEALHNAAKHSGAKRVDVQLREESGQVQLIVIDSGKGFDATAVSQDRGLGITSMQERVRLVHGTIVIDSTALAGTAIRVRLPLGAR